MQVIQTMLQNITDCPRVVDGLICLMFGAFWRLLPALW